MLPLGPFQSPRKLRSEGSVIFSLQKKDVSTNECTRVTSQVSLRTAHSKHSKAIGFFHAFEEDYSTP